MTDQSTVPPPPAPRSEDDPVWRRLVTDCAAFQRQYPTPAHLAELVKQAIVEGFVQGVRYAQPERGPWVPSPDQTRHIIAGIMNGAARDPGDDSVKALHALAHAGQRARAHAATTADTGETTTGGNCGG